MAQTTELAMQLRTPAVLAAYRCGHSLVCCAAPWRATLQVGEFESIESALQVRADPSFSAAAWHDAVLMQHPPGLVRQPHGQCTILDPSERLCRLQRSAGLQALPVSCRNFPRSVVATPAGLEIAFTLACPTAARTVGQTPVALVWQTSAAAQCPYPPVRTVGDRVAMSRVVDWNWSEFDDFRAQWWRCLGGVASGSELAALLLAMIERPLQPPRSLPLTSHSELGGPWTQLQVRAVTEGLAHLHDTGHAHRAAQRDYWPQWLATPDRVQVLATFEQYTAVLACHAGLVLQHAAVHDGLPAAEGIARAARQTVAAARALQVLDGQPQGIRDALIAAAHWARGLS
ncbi:MAG: hypothetical protein EXR77_12280 [Myxococcales bacterium]|nr:hypothetical protein [Myxococcales bacterium]